MFCKDCGKQIDNDSRFCRHCGNPQSQPDQAAPTSDPPVEATDAVDQASREQDGAHTSAPDSRRLIGLMLVGTVLFIALIALVSGSKNASLPSTPSSDTAAADQIIANIEGPLTPEPTSSPAAPSNWSYSSDEDKIRGKTTFRAMTTSTNSIQQAAPYDGGTTMTIHLRKSPAYGVDVILTISQGQMMCPSYEGCSATVRFDDGPPQHVSLSGPEDGSSETVFVDGAQAFIAKLKRAKKVVIEKTLYQAGSPQFEFDVGGLKWTH